MVFCTKCVNETLLFGIKALPSHMTNLSPLRNLRNFFCNLNPCPPKLELKLWKGSTAEFSALNIKDSHFSLFHLNIASLSLHFDELKNLLGLLGHGFDIIGITETKFQTTMPPINCDLPGYTFVHTPTESENGGALLYAPNALHFIECPKLDALIYKSKDLESKFIEIIRPNSKNIIVGCIYRHPRMSVDDFNNNYIMPLLVEISSGNKEIFLLGDFNMDLLKSDSVKGICDHLDILLPHIILPTRVTETTSTIIDNIFF